MELSEANSWNSVNNATDSQMKVNTWQTDESKATEQQNSFCLQQPQTNKSYVPCLADTGNYFSYIYVCIAIVCISLISLRVKCVSTTSHPKFIIKIN